MQIFLLTLSMMALLMLAMAVGVIFSNRELKGSCGGVNRCICEETGRKMPENCKMIKEAVARLHERQEAELESEG